MGLEERSNTHISGVMLFQMNVPFLPTTLLPGIEHHTGDVSMCMGLILAQVPTLGFVLLQYTSATVY